MACGSRRSRAISASRRARPDSLAASTSFGLDVEILVNNAGFATGGPFYEADLDRELEQVRVLVEAVVVLTHMFSPAWSSAAAAGS